MAYSSMAPPSEFDQAQSRHDAQHGVEQPSWSGFLRNVRKARQMPTPRNAPERLQAERTLERTYRTEGGAGHRSSPNASRYAMPYQDETVDAVALAE